MTVFCVFSIRVLKLSFIACPLKICKFFFIFPLRSLDFMLLFGGSCIKEKKCLKPEARHVFIKAILGFIHMELSIIQALLTIKNVLMVVCCSF